MKKKYKFHKIYEKWNFNIQCNDVHKSVQIRVGTTLLDNKQKLRTAVAQFSPPASHKDEEKPKKKKKKSKMPIPKIK